MRMAPSVLHLASHFEYIVDGTDKQAELEQKTLTARCAKTLCFVLLIVSRLNNQYIKAAR